MSILHITAEFSPLGDRGKDTFLFSRLCISHDRTM